MTPLPLKLSISGFNYTQIDRSDRYALYEQVRINDSKFTPVRVKRYEVIKIKKQKEAIRFGKSYEAKEMFPCTNDWGTSGWSFLDLESARKHFDKLCKTKAKATV